MKLKKIHLPIVVAEASDLPLGTLGEFITADTLKPYLDQIGTKSTPEQISTAVNALKTELVGTAGISVDTFGEMKTFVDSVQSLQQSDKDSILSVLATCVKTADIMPIVNAKASEQSVATRLAEKVATADIMPIVNTKATKVELQAEVDLRTSEVARVQAIADSKTTEPRAFEIADYIFGSKIVSYNQHIEAVEVIANSKTTNEHLEVRIAEVLDYESNRDVNTRADLVTVATNKANDAFTNAKADSRGYVDNQILNLNQNVLPLLESKAEANASIAILNAAIATKTTPTYVGTEINIARNDVRGYVDIQVNDLKQNVLPLLESKAEANASIEILNTAIATKTTGDQVNDIIAYWRSQFLTPQYEGMVDGLRTEMLAIEGIDQAEFTRLRDLLAQLTALESADVTGIMTLLSQKIDKNRALGFNTFKSHYGIANAIEFKDVLASNVGSELIVSDETLLNILKEVVNYADTKFAKDNILDEAWLKSHYNIADVLEFVNTTDADRNDGELIGAKVLRNILHKMLQLSDTKVAKVDVLDESIFPDTASLFATYITPDARLTKDKYFNALNLRSFFANQSNYTDTVATTKFAKDHVLKLDTVQGMWNFINDMTVQELEDKVVDANVLRLLINDLFGHLNTKASIAEAFAKDHVLNSTWSIALLPSWIAFKDATDEQIGSGKVLDAQILRNIFREVVNHADTKVEGLKIPKLSWIDPNQPMPIEHFLNYALLNSDHVFSAELTQELIKILNAKVDTKIAISSIITEGQLVDFNTEIQSDDTVMSSASVKNRLYEVHSRINNKANSADIFTKDETFNRDQVMSGLNERATNARVQELEDQLAAAKQDIETLKSYFE